VFTELLSRFAFSFPLELSDTRCMVVHVLHFQVSNFPFMKIYFMTRTKFIYVCKFVLRTKITHKNVSTIRSNYGCIDKETCMPSGMVEPARSASSVQVYSPFHNPAVKLSVYNEAQKFRFYNNIMLKTKALLRIVDRLPPRFPGGWGFYGSLLIPAVLSDIFRFQQCLIKCHDDIER
jgi:hypothetical protein